MMRKQAMKSRTVRSALRIVRSLLLTMRSFQPMNMNQPVSRRARRGKDTKNRINSGRIILTASPIHPATMSRVLPLTPSSTPIGMPAIMNAAPITVKAKILPK